MSHESGYWLHIQADLAKASRSLWSCLVAAGCVREYRLPTRIYLVGDATDEQKEAARVAWPMAERRLAPDWSRVRKQDGVICTADNKPPHHGGARAVIHAENPDHDDLAGGI